MILITEFMDEAAVAGLRSRFDVTHVPDYPDCPHAHRLKLRKAEALIVRNRTRVGADVLDVAESLRCIGRLGVGLDNIDVEACRKKGVAVFTAAGANARSVAEYVLATSMILVRGAFFLGDKVMAGGWPREEASGSELAGKRLGLVGFGATARETAGLMRGLDVEIAACDPFLDVMDPAWKLAERMELDPLLAISDLVSLHIPLVETTRHLIDAGRLQTMKQGAVLINASRGGIVDERALTAALRSGRLGGAALDVFETEPLTAEAARGLRDCPGLILTPHIAGVTRQANRRVSALVSRKVTDHLTTAAASEGRT